jgi:hypothetical protein
VFLYLLPFILLILFILCSHVFGTVSDLSDLDGSQTAADDDDIEDEYETVRRQRSEKRARIASQRSRSLEI